MAEKKDKPSSKESKKPLSRKKSLTVRERATASAEAKPKRIRRAAGKAKLPLGRVKKLGKSEYHIPLPDNKAGRVLRKRIRFIPKFVREAFAEIKLVTWPDTKTTIRLTIAVFIFAVVFASIVGALDYVLGELFERFFINNT